MLTTPPSINEQALQMGANLQAWCDTNGGTVKVCAQQSHFWEEVYKAQDAPRILIVSDGEAARGGFDQANTLHRVDRQWIVAIIYGHGFKSQTGQSETETMPFTDAVEAIREVLRCMLNVSEEFPIDYKGWKPLPPLARPGLANVFVDGASITFSTANDIAAITTQDPNPTE